MAPWMQAAAARAWHHPSARMRSSLSRALNLAAEVSLALLVVSAPLALGGAAPWALYPLVGLSLLAFCLALAGSWRHGYSVHLPIPSWLLLVSCAVIALQLVPLPPPLLAWLSAPAAEVRDFALVPLGLTRWRPVSLDPPATWRELAKHVAYLATFLAVAQLSRSRGARGRLLLALVASAALVALIGVLHAVLNLHVLFGVHAFAEARPPFLTVFGNPNHAAAFMAVGSLVALGLGFAAPDRSRALPHWGAAAGLGVAVILTLSRGGILFLFAGQALFLVLLLRARRLEARAEAAPDAPGRRLAPAWVGVTALAVAAVGAFIAYEQLGHELHLDEEGATATSSLQRDKVAQWPMALRAAMKFAPAGMGRGAYESGLSRFQTESPNTLFTHPENGVLQLLSELGLPVAAALLALGLVWLLRVLRGKRNGPEELALLAAVLATLLHDVFDFSLELAPTALALCFAVGALDRPGSGSSSQRWSLHRRVAPLAAVGMAALAALGLLFGRSTLLDSEGAVRDALARRVSGAELMTVVVREVDRHPADYVLYSLAGAGFSAKDPLQALAFLNRALFLRPLDVDSHRAAARALLRLKKRHQAMLEYGLAYKAMVGERDTAPVMDEAVAAARGLDELSRLVAEDDIDGLAAIAARLQWAQRWDESGPFLAWALERNQGDVRAEELWFWEANARYSRRDLPGALEAVARAEQTENGRLRVAIAKASVLAGLGRSAEAIEGLTALCAKKPAVVEIAFALVRHLLEAQRPNLARQALNRARPFLANDWQRREAYNLEGASFMREGRHARALQAYQSGLHLAPKDAGLHYALAEALEGLGRFDEAIAEVQKGMALEPQVANAGRKEWISRLQLQRAKPLPAPAPEGLAGPDDEQR